MRNKILTVLILLAMIGTAQAQVVSVNDVLTKAGAREGVIYDFKAQRGLNFLAATIYETGNLALIGGLVSTDGIGVALDYEVGPLLPKVNLPVLGIINSLRVGIGTYIRTTTIHTDAIQTTKDDNKLGVGPTMFVKWVF